MTYEFQPSAKLFLDALNHESDREDLLDHVFDEIRLLALNPVVNMEDKYIFPIPHSDTQFYRILFGKPILGRSFWYIYEPDDQANLLHVHNIGTAGVEKPFLSRL